MTNVMSVGKRIQSTIIYFTVRPANNSGQNLDDIDNLGFGFELAVVVWSPYL